MRMCSYVMEQFCQKETNLMRLESLVNPLLDQNDLVGLSYLLQQAVEAMRAVQHSRPFHVPVDKRRYPVSQDEGGAIWVLSLQLPSTHCLEITGK